jgi:hypothetical protein
MLETFSYLKTYISLRIFSIGDFAISCILKSHKSVNFYIIHKHVKRDRIKLTCRLLIILQNVRMRADHSGRAVLGTNRPRPLEH